MFMRSWVRIQHSILHGYFFTSICCKICIVCLKKILITSMIKRPFIKHYSITAILSVACQLICVYSLTFKFTIHQFSVYLVLCLGNR